MTSDFRHQVLIVEGNDKIKKAIASILKNEDVDTAFSDTGESALEKIKQAKTPYSLMICAQSLDGMKGTDFLGKAAELMPDSIRFLMAKCSEMETIINAVNQSSVQRFFVKPFEKRDFIKAIRSSLKEYSSLIEHKKLFALAKKQNSKLFELNCELMEATKTHNKTIQKLDIDIESAKKDIKLLSSEQQKSIQKLLDKMSDHVKTSQGLDAVLLENLLSKTIKKLHEQFERLASENGFEMSELKDDNL